MRRLSTGLTRTAMLGIGAVGLAGCFQYYPAASELLPAPGTDIRATLVKPTPFDMGTETISDVTRVEGTLVVPGSDSLGVWVRWLRQRIGPKYTGNRAEFYLQRSNIQRLDQWRFSPKRTVLAVGIGGAALAGLARLIGLVGVAGNGGGGPPNTQ